MVVQTLIWLLLPALVYGTLAYAFFEESPRPGVRAGRRLASSARRRLGTLLPGARRRREVRAATAPLRPTDPFDALTVQLQLARLSAHVRDLEADPRTWARGRRMLAAQLAYDALLAEACRLAGVDVLQDETVLWGPTREPERFREEMELASRGWSW